MRFDVTQGEWDHPRLPRQLSGLSVMRDFVRFHFRQVTAGDVVGCLLSRGWVHPWPPENYADCERSRVHALPSDSFWVMLRIDTPNVPRPLQARVSLASDEEAEILRRMLQRQD
jgi:hypothetical protein